MKAFREKRKVILPAVSLRYLLLLLWWVQGMLTSLSHLSQNHSQMFQLLVELNQWSWEQRWLWLWQDQWWTVSACMMGGGWASESAGNHSCSSWCSNNSSRWLPSSSWHTANKHLKVWKRETLKRITSSSKHKKEAYHITSHY